MERKTDARRNVESAEIGVALTVVHTEVVGLLGVVLVFAVAEHVHTGGLLSKEEAERSVIEWRIKRKIERKEFDYEDLLEEYRECGEINSFERQIHDLYLSLLLRHKGMDWQSRSRQAQTERGRSRTSCGARSTDSRSSSASGF